MTHENYELDPVVLTSGSSLTLYRIANTRYAVLSGAGAALFPGRWNHPGEEAIYTSIDVGLPVLETLVHTTKSTIPTGQALMRIRLSHTWKRAVVGVNPGRTILLDRATGGVMQWFTSLALAERAFADGWYGVPPVAVALPSVVAPAWNVVLFPEAPGFWKHVSLESVEPFQFDPRLFPENSISETSSKSEP